MIARLISLILGKPDPWASFQAHYAHRIAQARAKHGRVKEIERERQDALHEALRAGR